MKHLWTVYRWACGDCGRLLWEARVPTGHTVKDYAPTACGACGSTHVTRREKAA